MKTHLTIFFLLIAHFMNAQSGIIWEPAIDVASNSFDNLHPRIVCDRSGNPMLIWGKGSTKQVHFSRWDTAALAFTTPLLINPNTIPVFAAGWAGPDITSFGDTVYIVMKETPEDTNHMYLSRSFDGGMNFLPPVQVDFLIDSISRFPTIGTDSAGNPVVAYMNFELGFNNPSYVVMKSNDYGNTFANPVLASEYSGGEACDCCPASLVTSGNKAAMLYRDNLNNFRTMWAGVSTDNCQTFPNGMSIDHTNWMINACPSTGPDGVIIGDSLYTVYMSGITGDARCYLNAASLSQMNSGPDESLTGFVPGLSNQNFPRISSAGKKTGIVCRQSVNGTDEIALFYTDDITSVRPFQNYDTLASGVIDNCDITMTADKVYVVWQDNNSGTVKFRKGSLPLISSTLQKDIHATEFSIFPSPAKDHFTLNCDECSNTSIEMYDLTGRYISLTISGNDNKATCRFSATDGIYFVKANNRIKKLIVRN